ncbi:short-chain dehydrogenase reductase [Fusarium globosum]|uniref:Short-chain dehydrogenase reductase n=3 Tax=Fusarium TaxID=5506 RepID=A0A8H6CXW4_9HYPO|nr:short-chain dehydrogenase reductase [Fusarium beomiforme]KAF4414751.1 short-chain dehydrogenase reductase [Fusarium acutatum]KAF5696298.1 short-chain dehydrogenase reductase [Fusarium globosum]
MSSLSQLSQQYSPIALKLAKSRGVRMLTLGIGLFVALRRLNGWLSWRKANNGVTRKMWHAEKEIIVVTGGSSGIGETIVQLLEERNIKVIILDINAPARKLGHRTAFYEIDLSDSDAIATIAGQIRSQHGNPTVLVNNAGFANGESLISVTPEKLHRIFNVNLAAPFLLVREFLPDMVAANYGHIVNVSSLASFFTQALNVDYCATKAGVLALHEGILQELKYVHNAPAVRATVVHPKWVKTAMCEKLIGTGKLGAHVTAHDVASAVVSQVTSGYGGQLIVPPGMGWTSIVRGLPAWIQEIARDAVSQEYVGALQHLS